MLHQLQHHRTADAVVQRAALDQPFAKLHKIRIKRDVVAHLNLGQSVFFVLCADVDQQLAVLQGLAALARLLQVHRLAADHARHSVFADAHALGDANRRVHAAHRQIADHAVIADILHEEAYFVHVCIDHYGGCAFGFAVLPRNDAAHVVHLDLVAPGHGLIDDKTAHFPFVAGNAAQRGQLFQKHSHSSHFSSMPVRKPVSSRPASSQAVRLMVSTIVCI